MNIQTHTEDGVTVLELKGRLSIGEGDVVLREAVLEVLEGGARKILLNLRGVKTMDSSGLGELVRCKSTVMRWDATIKLLHAEDKVREVLEMTRLIGVFETYDDPIDALASFREA